jgi:hypothetical protein
MEVVDKWRWKWSEHDPGLRRMPFFAAEDKCGAKF